MTRVAFLGTPDAAVPTLDEIFSEFDVPVVITQPDRPKGRSATPEPSPVAMAARRLRIPLRQPGSSQEIAAILSETTPLDVAVVVGFGMILSPDALEVPAHGILNLHFSLLPRWRGAAPVARALMAGDSMTGVTIIRIDEKVDAGDVLTAQAVDIGAEEVAGSLTMRLAQLGARLMTESIEPYLVGELSPVPQVDEGLTHAAKISSEDRPLSIDSTVLEFTNQVRGLSPSPAATLQIDGSVHKILRANLVDAIPAQGTWQAVGDTLIVGVADGGVELAELQPPGKRVMSGGAWLRGRLSTRGEVS